MLKRFILNDHVELDCNDQSSSVAQSSDDTINKQFRSKNYFWIRTNSDDNRTNASTFIYPKIHGYVLRDIANEQTRFF
uniref:Uncharacterized protein n=1 Tax=Setaria digitata TaxID=48799 RepID=A0A915Q549_9BILA